MRFEEAYRDWQAKRLTQEEIAELLGVCCRTFRRYIDRYEEQGLEGLIDKRLNEVSHRRAPVNEVMRLTEHDQKTIKAGMLNTIMDGVSVKWVPAAIRGLKASYMRLN